ncbi:NUDIX hydrolase [uncultured Intestinimonas sp.]|uniref:NUDIX hydrolase N-terminal domain-containing protein n=1 Tax=uncultured Intestinimonas sp. TaxID=1689265 RepID=UPI0025E146CD|nr:NUDIX hydrolase [uncultured Intestinimonas sp.]
MTKPLPRWTDWARELQTMAQAGLTYSTDPFDRERFQRIREISAEMAAEGSGLPLERVTDLFCGESGYQTPKLETRAALFQGDAILLVQERDGRWALPGGWVDENLSVRSNAVKEVLEEAGLEAEALRLIALQDRNLRNPPPYLHGICKVFVLCRALGGQFRPNLETLDSGWFSLDRLPPLAEEKTTTEQIALCFAAYRDPNWVVPFD